ncbi:MAG: hypothetical protein KDI88_04535 [Gammaproteobacteria bacterium]|nr:hypothetical protein [Gammaproteobacteria bacterium]
MNKSAIGFTLSVAIAVHGANASDALDLEPCIDGGVSATGLYVDQASEDLALLIEPIMADDEYALEPCINGGVSALGTLPADFSSEGRLASAGTGQAE